MVSKKWVILIVDDEGNTKNIQRALKKIDLQCHIFSAVSIEQSLQICMAQKINCMLIGHQLMGASGLDEITALNQQFPFMAIIMLVRSGDEMVAIDALKHGVSDCIIKKKVDSILLGKTIYSAIGKKKLEKKLNHVTHYDYLTDTPNRLYFEQLISKELAYAKHYQKTLCLFFIDIDRFKTINDALGYEIGDLVLQQVVKRFKSVLQEKDLLARLGGDEFGILTGEINQIEEATLLAKKLLFSLKPPFLLNNEKVTVTVSIGIAMYPQARDSVSELMRSADKAMSQVKKTGKNNFIIYKSNFDQTIVRRFHIETALRNAIEKKELYLHYQPIYNLSDLSLFGVEALLRWNHDEFGQFSIDEIISVAEESGLIISIGDWVINEAFRQYNDWSLQANTQFKLAINISPDQLVNTNFVSNLEKSIQNYQMNPNVLIFELTETDVIKQMFATQKTLASITEMGVQIFVDDFGMGYSSLNIIKNIPISGIKIDRHSIKNLSTRAFDRNLVNSLFLLAKNMGFAVVAEGIETKAQLDLLKPHAGEMGQGNYLSVPLSSDEIAKLILNITPLITNYY